MAHVVESNCAKACAGQHWYEAAVVQALHPRSAQLRAR
jgi:hypothetical protein